MKRRRVILIAVACLVAVVVAFVVWPGEREPAEPSYGGKSLTRWLEATNSRGSEEAKAAVRQIGTNALPWLIKWVSYEPAPWRRRWSETLRRLPQPADRLARLGAAEPGRAWKARSALAACGFEILGVEGRAAIPKLIELVNGSNSVPQVKGAASFALNCIGPEAVLASDAVPLLRNPNIEVRVEATNTLRRIAPEVLVRGR